MGSSTESSELCPLELHALAIAGKEAKRWRDSLLVRPAQEIDFCVYVSGSIDVGAEQHRIKTTTPALDEVLAFCFSTLGEKTRQKLASAISTAFSAANQASAPAPPHPQMLGLAQTVIEQVTHRENTTARGNVTGHVSLRRIHLAG